MREKACPICEKVKPLSDFGKKKRNPDGHSYQCKACLSERQKLSRKENPEKARARDRRDRTARQNNAERHAKYTTYSRAYAREHFKRHYARVTYNLQPEEYEAMFTSQNNLCAICNKPETTVDPRTKQCRKLCVDHDHATGKVRGLLCFRCNTSLAFYENNMAAIHTYLEKHGNEE